MIGCVGRGTFFAFCHFNHPDSGWDRDARQTRSATESNIEKDASHASAAAGWRMLGIVQTLTFGSQSIDRSFAQCKRPSGMID
jgi:hypothetical protein